MVTTIKLTSKRQATFPAALCRELGVKPGDELVLERRSSENQVIWVLRHPTSEATPWFACLRAYGAGKKHDLESIRRSIGSRQEGSR